MTTNSLLKDVVVLGVHRVQISTEEFNSAVAELWGAHLKGEKLAQARMNTWEHFENLHLLEVTIHPADAEVDWGAFTQRCEDVSEENWQVPYDEQLIDALSGRWVFFLHDVDFSRPLTTPVGERRLPTPTPRPEHLRHIVYQLP